MKWHNSILTVLSASGLEPPVQLQGRQRAELQPKMCQQEQGSCVGQNWVQLTVNNFCVCFHYLCFLVDGILSRNLNSIFILLVKRSVCDMCRFQDKVSEKNSLKLAEEPKIAKSPGFQELGDSICYQILPASVKQLKWLIQLTCSKFF